MAVRDQVQLLLWRAGYGATPAQVDAATAKGYAQAVEDVLTFGDPLVLPTIPAWPAQLPPNATADQRTAYNQAVNDANNQGSTIITNWWANLLHASQSPLQETLTLFWHNHFATANDKVRRPAYMLGQNRLFRTQGAGKFVDLLIAVSKDPAMLIWLDDATNVKAHPNENWAREVRELFTLGIGNYTESDVREAASGYTPAVRDSTSQLAAGLQTVAQLIHGNVGARVSYLATGGFDTHSNQRGTHDGLMQTLGDALGAFWQDITAHGHADSVALMTFSEFGRRARTPRAARITAALRQCS